MTAPAKHVRPGIRAHRSTVLTPADRSRWLGVPVTSAARTVLDVAPGLSDRQLTRMVNDARHAGSVKVAALSEMLDRCPNHPGAERVRAVLVPGQGPTRSHFEDIFVALALEHGLPVPKVNTTINGHEVDALFVAEKLIVELDGWEFHSDRQSFESDRERDMTHAEAGYLTVRITWQRLCTQPAAEAQRLRTILALRR